MSTSDAPRGPGAAPREGLGSSLERAEVSQSQLLAAPRSRFGGPGRLIARLGRWLLRSQFLPQASLNAAVLDSLRSVEPGLASLEKGVSGVEAHLSRIDENASALGQKQQALVARQEGFESSALQPALDRLANIERHLSDFGNDLAADFATVRASIHAQGRQVDEVAGELVAATADIEKVEEEWEVAQAKARKVTEGFEARIRTLEKRLEPLRSMDYFDFARRYRGDSDKIRERLRKYAQVFGEVGRVLDFGCGRGEFLEVCGEMKIGAYGVDSDPDMVSHCKLRQVDAIEGDAMDHVRNLPTRYLDGFFSAQVVEHLTPAELVELVELLSTRIPCPRRSGWRASRERLGIRHSRIWYGSQTRTFVA